MLEIANVTDARDKGSLYGDVLKLWCMISLQSAFWSDPLAYVNGNQSFDKAMRSQQGFVFRYAIFFSNDCCRRK